MHWPSGVSLVVVSACVRITANSRGVVVAMQFKRCCWDPLCADAEMPARLVRRGLRQQRFAWLLHAELQSAGGTRSGMGDCLSQGACITVSGGLQLLTQRPLRPEPAKVGSTLHDRGGFVSSSSSNQMWVLWHLSCLRSALEGRRSDEHARPTRKEQLLVLISRNCCAAWKALE